MIPHHNSALSNWVSELLASGRCVFTSDEAIQKLGIGRGSFLDAAERLQRKRHLFSPKRGFYVIVPPRFLSWGATPPNHYIDDLMEFKYCPYYVGLLKAAALHGATHQAVMEFQVMVGKRISKIHAGRYIIAFYFSKNISNVTRGIQLRKTPTGYMKIFSPELTALDLDGIPTALPDQIIWQQY